MTLRQRTVLTLGVLLGVGLAVAVLTVFTTPPMLPIVAGVFLALVFTWRAGRPA